LIFSTPASPLLLLTVTGDDDVTVAAGEFLLPSLQLVNEIAVIKQQQAISHLLNLISAVIRRFANRRDIAFTLPLQP
jgi:hypothetical protein